MEEVGKQCRSSPMDPLITIASVEQQCLFKREIKRIV